MIWRGQFERHGLRVSRTKTAYNDYDNNSRKYEDIQLGDDELNTVKNSSIWDQYSIQMKEQRGPSTTGLN